MGSCVRKNETMTMEPKKFSLISVTPEQRQTKDFLSLLTQCNFDLQEERKGHTEFELAKLLQQSRQRILNDFAVMQASIVFRAVKAGDKYMAMYKESNGTDEKCSLRPKLKIDANYSTLEMAWVRRIDRVKPAKASTQPVASAHFRRYKIETANGVLTVSHHYEYIKKGLEDRYSNRIFRDQPLWAQKLGAALEDKFSLLRQEQKKLSALRKALKGLHLFQGRWFNDQVKKQVNEWLDHEQLEIVSFGDDPNSWLKGEIRIVNEEKLNE